MARHTGISSRTPVVRSEVRKGNDCLSALSSHALSLLRPYLTEIVFPEGSILWDSRKLSPEVYFPVSGLISIILHVSDGISVEVGNVSRQAAAGAIFEPGQVDFCTQGVVQLGSSFIRMPGSKLFFAAKENSEIENLVNYCRDWILMQSQQMAACNAAHSADKRFCRWLFQVSERMETDAVYLTQEMIASLLAIRRTTVTLIAQKLQAEGLIQYRRGKIAILDQARLRVAACECCNSLSHQHWPSTRLLNANALKLRE